LDFLPVANSIPFIKNHSTDPKYPTFSHNLAIIIYETMLKRPNTATTYTYSSHPKTNQVQT
jgi:hypothetical protein